MFKFILKVILNVLQYFKAVCISHLHLKTYLRLIRPKTHFKIENKK